MKINLKTIFLRNLGVKQTIFKNTFWLALAEAINRFLKLILIIYVARILGVTEYGKFTFALAFVSLFIVFSDFGLSPIITRELAKEKERETEYPAVFFLKILLGLGTLALMLVGSFFITPDSQIQKVIWILALYILISNFFEVIYAFLRALQRMEYESWAKIFQATATVSAGFFIILNFPSVINLSYGYLFASLITLIFLLIFFHFKIYRLSLNWDTIVWKKFLLMSWPLALIIFLGAVSALSASVIMGYFGQINQTGLYNAAYKIIGVSLIPMFLISQAFYPMLSGLLKESKENFQKLWNYQMEIMIFLAAPLVAGGMILAPKIIYFIYGFAFSPSVLVFQILIIMAGLIFLYNPLSQVLVVFNQQKKILWIVLFTAIINVVLNLILIPKFSLYGAAFVMIITHLLILLLLLTVVFKSTFLKLLKLKFFLSFSGAVFCSFLMYSAISQPRIYHFNVFILILIGILTYSLSFFLYKKLINKVFA